MVPSLEGIAPFQIAFVVSDLERAAHEFDALLAAGPWRGWTFGPQGQGREYRGHPAEWTLRLALNNRSPQYELIEPLDGPSIHADWLNERGEGFHHVGYVVTSLVQTTAEMEAAGHPPIAHPFLRSCRRRRSRLLRHGRGARLRRRSRRAALPDATDGLHALDPHHRSATQRWAFRRPLRTCTPSIQPKHGLRQAASKRRAAGGRTTRMPE
jgi:hypothetical protein